MKKLLFIFILTFPLLLNATHLVGGCFELKWLGGDNYRLIVRILRDCENGQAPFDSEIAVGFFEKTTHIKKKEVILSYNASEKEVLKFTGPNCANIVNGCTEIATYTQNITLPANQFSNNGGYYLSWQRCCRNGIISNIIQPGNAAMTLYAEIPCPKFVKNSTPHYSNSPNTLLCANNLFRYNMNFVDDDGDELRYSLIEPINGNLTWDKPSSSTATAGPYSNIVWRNGYNNQNVITGNLSLAIDSATGELTCNPNAAGVYVASIRVREFRFGVKIGEVRLELQFTVTNCPNNPPMASIISINNQLLTGDTIEVQVPDEICVKIRGIDQTDSVFMRVITPFSDSVYANLPVYDTLNAGYLAVETKFCIQSACEHEKVNSPFPVYVSITDNGCPISRNAEAIFWVRIKPMPLANPTDLLCMTLVDNKETYFYYGDSTSRTNPYWNKYYIYRGIDYKNNKILDSIFTKFQNLYHDINTPDYENINYTYYMVGINHCLKPGPTSDTLGTFEQLKFIPEKQFLKFVSVANNKHLEMVWPATWERDFAKYFLYKSIRGSNNFELIHTFEALNDTAYIDMQVNVKDTSYCYYLVMKDTCDNIGPMGKVACSVVLKGQSGEFMNKLSWSDYLGWEAGVEQYKILRSDPSTPFLQIAKTDGNLFLTDDKLNLNEGLFYYHVIAKEKWSENYSYFGSNSQSNTIELLQAPIVYVPNAFTANGDGLNDQFKWVPVFVKDFNIQIFNRWGELIYQTNDKYAPWDGQYKDQLCATDVYFYRMSYTGWEGSEKYSSGNFTLLR